MRYGDINSDGIDVTTPTLSVADANSTPWWQSLTDTLSKAGTIYLNLEQQKQLNDINTQRAAKGLPPLDASQYQAGVNVGLSSSTQNTVLLLGGGVILAIVISSLMKSRR